MGFQKLPRLLHPDLSVPGQQPQGPVEIDWANGLTRGLVGFWILNRPNPVNLARPGVHDGKTITSGGNGKFANTAWGRGFLTEGELTTDRIACGSSDQWPEGPTLRGRNKFTIATTYKSVSSLQTSGRLVDCAAAAVTQDGWTMYYHQIIGQLSFANGQNQPSNDRNVWILTSLPTGASPRQSFAVRNDGTALSSSTGLDFFVDGVNRNYTATQQTAGADSISTQPANLNFCNWHDAGGDRESNGIQEYVAIWTRDLTDEELTSFQLDPYQVVKPAISQFAYKPEAGASAITASESLTIAASAALTATGTLAAAAALAVSTSGALAATGELTAAESVTISPVGAVAGTGALAGAEGLTIAATGALTGTGALAAAETVTISATGTMEEGAIEGVVSLAFSDSATLAGLGALAGAEGLTLSATGTLGSPGDLAAAISVSFTTAADLAGTGALAAVEGLNVSVTADLAGTGALALAEILTISATANLTAQGSATRGVATPENSRSVFTLSLDGRNYFNLSTERNDA